MKPDLNPSPSCNSSSLGRGLGRCRGDVKRTTLALCLLAGFSVHAQSDTLLEAIRYGRADAPTLAGQELTACMKSDCLRQRELSLLVGYLELARGDADAAASVLQGSPPPVGLESLHGYYLGTALFYKGRHKQAAAALEAGLKDAPPWLEPRLRAKLGEAWFEAGEAKPACAELERVTSGASSPELHYRRARCRSSLGNVAGAKADWEVLALSFPSHPYAQPALDELTKPPAAWKPSLDDRLKRGRSFLQASDPVSCVRELERAEKEGLLRGDTAETRWSLQRITCLYAADRTEEAEREVKRVIQRGPSGPAAEAQLQRARHTLRSHDNPQALKQMLQVVADHPTEGPAREAGYLAGWLQLQTGKYEDAIKTLDAHEQRRPGAGRSDDVLWLGAWARIRLGRYAEAQAKLLDLESTFSKSELLPQVRYWTARCQQFIQSAAAAAPLYQHVIDLHPQTLYGTLARERLRETGNPALYPFGPLPSSVRGMRGAAPSTPQASNGLGLELAQALARSGLLRDASRELQRRVGAVKGTDAALRLGAALQRMGEFGFAHTTAARALWGTAYGQRSPEALVLLYPRAFDEAVEAAAKEQGLDPFWIWSLMRRESAFRPDVTSAADARGLMQMIPKTAAAVAEALGVPRPDPGDLYRPELNVRFAAWYLAALQKRFGHPALIAAAYNAGPSAVLRWIDERGDLPMDAFIEEIPYKETRAYVKQVWSDYHLYRALYAVGAKVTPVDLVVPKPSAEGVGF